MSFATRYLVISDLHLGASGALLGNEAGLEALRPELERAEVLVVNGDCFDFLGLPLAQCLEMSRPFFDAVRRAGIEELIFIPGNHDYHFVAHDTDRRVFADLAAEDSNSPAFRLQSAEWVLRRLCPEIRVRTAYPLCQIEGVTITHGHYIDPHLGGLAYRLTQRVARRLAGLEAVGPELAAADYEALIAPLSELLYRAAQLPGSRRTWDRTEKLLIRSTALLRAPGKISRRLRRAEQEAASQESAAAFPMVLPDEAAEAMAEVARNLEIPSGQIVFGHTHVPFAAKQLGEWSFSNSGSWLLNRREARYPHYRHFAWPGTALRIQRGREPELVSCLEGASVAELEGMLPS